MTYVVMCTKKRKDMERNLTQMKEVMEMCMGNDYVLRKDKSNDGKQDW